MRWRRWARTLPICGQSVISRMKPCLTLCWAARRTLTTRWMSSAPAGWISTVSAIMTGRWSTNRERLPPPATAMTWRLTVKTHFLRLRIPAAIFIIPGPAILRLWPRTAGLIWWPETVIRFRVFRPPATDLVRRRRILKSFIRKKFLRCRQPRPKWWPMFPPTGLTAAHTALPFTGRIMTAGRWIWSFLKLRERSIPGK